MAGCHHQLDGHEFEQDLGDGEGQEAWHAAVHGVTKTRTWLNWTTASKKYTFPQRQIDGCPCKYDAQLPFYLPECNLREFETGKL